MFIVLILLAAFTLISQQPHHLPIDTTLQSLDMSFTEGLHINFVHYHDGCYELLGESTTIDAVYALMPKINSCHPLVINQDKNHVVFFTQDTD